MSELPESWSEVQLGQDVVYKKGKKPKNLYEAFKKDLMPYIDIKAFEKGIIRQYANINDGIIANKGDTLMVWDGARSGLVGNGIDGVIGSTLMRVRPIVSTQKYLHYFLKSKFSEINGNTKGTGIPHVDPQILFGFDYPIAPLPEQNRITDKLDTLLARVDATRERLDCIPATLKQFRQAVLAAATSGALTDGWRTSQKDLSIINLELICNYHEDDWPAKAGKYKKPDVVEELLWDIPSGWLWVTASGIVNPGDEIVYGIVQPGPKLDSGIPYVRGMDIVNGKILVDQLMKTSKEIAKKYSKASLLSGDVILGIIRATKVAVVPKSLDGANITQGTARLRPGKYISTNYLAISLEEPKIQNWLHDHYRGIDMPGLNLADIRKIPIPLPPIEEQKEIVRRVEKLFAFAESIEAHYQTARAQVDKLTPAILAKAFRGELVDQDSNDEPAKMLLERMQFSNAAQKKFPAEKIEKLTNPYVVSAEIAPVKRKNMNKNRLDADVLHKPYLASCIKRIGGEVTVEQLFQAAELKLPDFYKQLQWEVNQGMIHDRSSWLEVPNEA